jgi:hypothetical protein
MFFSRTDRQIGKVEVTVLALLLMRLVDQDKVRQWANSVVDLCGVAPAPGTVGSAPAATTAAAPSSAASVAAPSPSAPS